MITVLEDFEATGAGSGESDRVDAGDHFESVDDTRPVNADVFGQILGPHLSVAFRRTGQFANDCVDDSDSQRQFILGLHFELT